MSTSQSSPVEQQGLDIDLFKSSLYCVCATDAEGRLLHFSPGFTNLIVGAGSFDPPQDLASLIHPEDRHEFIDGINEICLNGKFLDRWSMRLVPPNGRVMLMQVMGEPWRENGIIRGGILLFIERLDEEVLHSCEATEQIDKLHEVAVSFAKSLFDPVVLVNTEGRIIEVNPPVLEMLGYRRVELISMPVAVLFEAQPESLSRAMAKFAHKMRTGKMQDVPTQWLTKTAEPIPVTMSGSVMRSASGELTGMVVVARDERKNTLLNHLEKKNLELEEAYDKLKLLDQMKDDILSLVGHELRAPLANILGYAEFLAEWDMPDHEKKEFVSIIYSEGQRLSRLVNDILDLTRMEAGRMKYFYHRDSINRVVQASVDSLRSDTDKKQLNIALELDDSQEPCEFDADRIQQVVTNIVHNAIKFTEPGKSIIVQTRAVEEGVLVSVFDQGPGIDPEDAERVFMKFEQLDEVKHHTIGAGLGMPIAKRIIEEGHGGKIWIESEGPGKGSVFRFIIPERRQTT